MSRDALQVVEEWFGVEEVVEGYLTLRAPH